MRRLDLEDPRAGAVAKLLTDGFASEVMRSLYLVKQPLRNGDVNGRPFSAAARAVGTQATLLVADVASPAPAERGLAIPSWYGGHADWPALVWLGLPPGLTADPAAVQTLSGRLARHTAELVASGGGLERRVDGGAGALVEGYGMAVEVIAREWRSPTERRGGVPANAGTERQRRLFADVRENRFALAEGQPRPAGALLTEPGVAATVLYRMAQSKAIAQRVADATFYAPFVTGRVPPNVSPAAVLGPYRNFQVKLLGTWLRATAEGRPPQDLGALVDLYGSAFPAERAEAVRLFVATTFGGTILPGGVSLQSPEETTRALARLTDDVLAGRRGLRDALGVAPRAPAH